MSDDQIAQALGQLMGKVDSLTNEFANWRDDHHNRHERIDSKLEEHSAAINQARGAKSAILVLAGTVSAIGGWLAGKMGKYF